MYEAVSEHTNQRLAGFFDEDELIEAIESASEDKDFWDIYRNGELIHYYTVSRVYKTYYMTDEHGMVWHGEWEDEDSARFFANSAGLVFVGEELKTEKEEN